MMNAQEIYENFAGARGPGDLEAAQEALHSVAAEYQVLAQEIANVAAAFEQGWTGDAAGAAERGAGPLTVQHAEASEALNLAQDLLRRQVESFWVAKNSVEPVPPVPAAPSTITNVITLGSAGAGYEQFVTEAGAAAQRNVAAMELWADHSAYNTTMMPTTYGEISPPEVSISLAEGTQLGGTGGGPPSTAEAPEPATTPGPATVPEVGTQAAVATAPGSASPVPAPASTPAVASAGQAPVIGTPIGGSPTAPKPVTPATPGPASRPSPAKPGSGAAAGTRATPGAPAKPGSKATPGNPGALAKPGTRATPGSPGNPAGPGSRATPNTPAHPATPANPRGTAKGVVPIAGAPAADRGRAAEDEEHERRYGVPEDKHFQPAEEGEKIVDPRTGLPVSQPVLGG